MTRPTFIGIGAQKAGTTTLHYILEQHPEIYTNPNKESHFFDDDTNYCSGSVFYELTSFGGYAGQKQLGEITPSYMFDPRVPQRIYNTLGADVKLIVILRDPIERAFSQYCMNLRAFREELEFANAIEREPERCAISAAHRLRYGYMARGRYREQLERFLRLYPREHLHIMLFEEDIQPAQSGPYQTLFEFLGVSKAELCFDIQANSSWLPCIIPFDQNGNKTWRIYTTDDATQVLPRGVGGTNWSVAVSGQEIQNATSDLNRFLAGYAELSNRAKRLDQGLRQDLFKLHVAPEIEPLQRLIKRELSAWHSGIS